MRLVSCLYDSFHPFDAFYDVECVVVTNPDDLQPGDVLILHGGADISPIYYNQQPSHYGDGEVPPSRRDRIEWACLQKALELKVPIIGICRGAQMLCAAHGGYLYQHVNNHAGRGHRVVTKESDTFYTNSLHHQMMVPNKNINHDILVWTDPLSNVYETGDEHGNTIQAPQPEFNIDPEFVYYPDTKAFAIQWHPEMTQLNTESTQYIQKVLNEHLHS